MNLTTPATRDVSQYAGRVLGCAFADWPKYRVLAVADTVEAVHEALKNYQRAYFVYAVPKFETRTR